MAQEIPFRVTLDVGVFHDIEVVVEGDEIITGDRPVTGPGQSRPAEGDHDPMVFLTVDVVLFPVRSALCRHCLPPVR